MPCEGVVTGRLAETVLPPAMFFTADEDWVAATLLSLVPGAVLATVLLCTMLEATGLVLSDVTLLPVVTLPVDVPPLVAVVLSAATVVFLLTVLLLPMPPLRLVPLVNTLSDPVVPLVPYHLSLWWMSPTTPW